MKALVLVYRDGRRQLFGFVPGDFDTRRHETLSRGAYCMQGIARLEDRHVFPELKTVH